MACDLTAEVAAYRLHARVQYDTKKLDADRSQTPVDYRLGRDGWAGASLAHLSVREEVVLSCLQAILCQWRAGAQDTPAGGVKGSYLYLPEAFVLKRCRLMLRLAGFSRADVAVSAAVPALAEQKYETEVRFKKKEHRKKDISIVSRGLQPAVSRAIINYTEPKTGRQWREVQGIGLHFSLIEEGAHHFRRLPFGFDEYLRMCARVGKCNRIGLLYLKWVMLGVFEGKNEGTFITSPERYLRDHHLWRDGRQSYLSLPKHTRYKYRKQAEAVHAMLSARPDFNVAAVGNVRWSQVSYAYGSYSRPRSETAYRYSFCLSN